MAHDWLLVETLGEEPAVVAQGDQLKNLVPVAVYLRRNPYLPTFLAAVTDTAASAAPMNHRTRDGRVVRTEPVLMTDGHVHGVHIWLGPPDAVPPPRPMPGPLVWNLSTGLATDTAQSLTNSGMDPDTEQTDGRTFAEDLPTRDLNTSETTVLSMTVKGQPGATFCNTWDVTDRQGRLITVGFVARSALETGHDGTTQLVARAMNWRSHRPTPAVAQDNLSLIHI